MATVVKKKKKVVARGSATGGSRTTSNLRPRYAPKRAPCQDRCPAGNDIRAMLTALGQTEGYKRSYEESYLMAWKAMAQTTPLMAVCGRVCPHPCEEKCNRQHRDEPLNVHSVERFIGDWARSKGLAYERLNEDSHKERVAVVGSGPAGLSCSYHLARRGYPVTLFEAFDKAGGMLRYGIPSYRLPRDVLDDEIQRILNLGVELRTRTVVGKDITLDQLRQEYQAIFMGIGAHKGLSLRVEGEEATNVMSGAEFLNRINSGESIDLGNDVVVIGGGDSAIDAARVARRLGANTTILYRRTVGEMPAISHEITEAELEGVNFEFLAAPIAIDREGDRGVAARCIRMELKEADKSGRPRPVPIEGSEYVRPFTTLIAGISQEPDFQGLEELRAGPRDWIKVNDRAETPHAGIYSGGDVLDLGLVTIAIGQGRKAAEAIDAALRGREPQPKEKVDIITHDKMKLNFYEEKARNSSTSMAVEERFSRPWEEINSGLGEDQARDESIRCMSCGACFDCDSCWMYCQDSVVVKLEKGLHYGLKIELCKGCKKCAEECPCGYIEMV